jgi:hypothetical protein
MTVVGVLSETPQGLGDFGCFSNGAKFKKVHNSTCDKQIIIQCGNYLWNKFSNVKTNDIC